MDPAVRTHVEAVAAEAVRLLTQRLVANHCPFDFTKDDAEDLLREYFTCTCGVEGGGPKLCPLHGYGA